MLRPVGKTLGPSLSKSPPGAGLIYPPSKPATTLVSSSVDWISNLVIDFASFSKSSSAVESCGESSGPNMSSRKETRFSYQDDPIFSFVVDCLTFVTTISRCSLLNRSPKYASRYAPRSSSVGSAPNTRSPEENNRSCKIFK